MTAQFQAFKALMGTLLAQSTEELPASGVPASCPVDVEHLNVDVIADELHTCIKHLKHGKSPGLDNMPAEMMESAARELSISALQLHTYQPFPQMPVCSPDH